METLTETPIPTPEPTPGYPLPFEYQVFTPESRHTETRTNTELQEKYLWMLGDLINKAVGNPKNRADTLVFMDKSARPLAWMMRTFWEELAPQEEDPETGDVHTIAMPDMKFANIDRLPWRMDPDKEISESGGGMKPIEEADVQGLRDVFSHKGKSLLDGKNIFIIDEQSESGDTITVAKALFSAAFPDAHVDGAPLLQHPYVTDPVTGKKDYKIKEIPPWYPVKDNQMLPDDERGRGVFGALPYERRSERFKRRFSEDSNQFLSSPIRQKRKDLTKAELAQLDALERRSEKAQTDEERQDIEKEKERIEYTSHDPKSAQLRREIGHMLIDFTAGRLNPSVVTDRQEIQGMPAAEYRARRNQP